MEQPTIPNPTLTDRIISFGLFFVLQMFFAFIIRLCLNKVLTSFHFQPIDYWTALALWLSWILFMVFPFLAVGLIVVQELSFQISVMIAKLFVSGKVTASIVPKPEQEDETKDIF